MRATVILALSAAVVCSVLIVAGDVAALGWIPHAGHDQTAPTVPGYVALYVVTVGLNLAVWLGVWQVARSPFT